MPSHTLPLVLASRTSAAHLPHGRRRTPLCTQPPAPSRDRLPEHGVGAGVGVWGAAGMGSAAQCGRGPTCPVPSLLLQHAFSNAGVGTGASWSAGAGRGTAASGYASVGGAEFRGAC